MSGNLHNRLLQSALDLAGRGFSVFPLKSGSKEPAVTDWQGKATTDPDIIRKVWSRGDFNIGVKTGGGLWVGDIDVRNGKQGLASWKTLGLSEEEHDTFVIQTASGGRHAYYACEDDFGNTAGRLGPGIDSRGAGGYVVGPGSVLTNGSGTGDYTILRDRPLRALPDGLRVRLHERRSPAERRTEPLVDLDEAGAIERAVAYLEQDAPTSGTYQVAARIKDFGVSQDTAAALLEEHWNDRRAVPHTFETLQEKVAHAYLYGSSPPGSDHPAAAFSGVAPLADPSPVQPAASRWAWHGGRWDKVGWLYHQILPAVGVACVVGPPQSGKSFVVIDIARSVASGKPFFSVDPDDRGGVAYLFAGTEGSALPMRLAALGETDELPIAWTAVSDLSARGALGKLLDALRDLSRTMQSRFGVPLRLIVLETLNASGLLVDENDNAEIGVAFANLATLSRELNCLVITTHHPPKSGSGARGGGAIEGSCDYILEITREGRDSVRFLSLTKARDAEQRELGTFTLLKTELGVDDRDRPITSMVISPGAPMNRQGRRSRHAEAFMQAVEFACMEAEGPVEGRRAADWETAVSNFRDLKTGSKDKFNVSNAFKNCFEYARDAGAVDSFIVAGTKYIYAKEIT